MSTTYAGGRSVAIQSSTNATPIAVTFQTPHGATSGDIIFISGHTGNGAANGEWSVIVTGATTLTLSGSTGSGVGGATGTGRFDSFASSMTIPSDGDNEDAASVNVAFEALADRTKYLFARMGDFRISGVSWNGQNSGSVSGANTWTTSGFTQVVLLSLPVTNLTAKDSLLFVVNAVISGPSAALSSGATASLSLQWSDDGVTFNQVDTGALAEVRFDAGTVDKAVTITGVLPSVSSVLPTFALYGKWTTAGQTYTLKAPFHWVALRLTSNF